MPVINEHFKNVYARNKTSWVIPIRLWLIKLKEFDTDGAAG